MTASSTPTIPSSVKPEDDLIVLGDLAFVSLTPRVCRAADTCPTYGGEFCPDNQALIDKCQHC